MRIRIACWIIEKGIRLLPKEFRNRRFIDNCIRTGHIKPDLEK